MALGLFAAPAVAQDFAAPGPAWPPAPACAALERGLPAASPSASLAGTVTRWDGVAALVTRGAAAGSGWGALRVALGLSQTGEPDVGWTALGLAVGAAGAGAGGALRAVERRDRTTPFGLDAHGARVGLEVGGGAWVEATTGVHVWASAPQIWIQGEAPPLARPLEIGGAVDLGGAQLWLSRAGVVGHPRGSRGEFAAGLATAAGPMAVWLFAREQPPRGGVGVSAGTRTLRVAAEVEGHPVLGETARMSLGLGGGR
jgi:hypothetical protein